MANKTVYPYGAGGSLPSSIGIVDDLVTGGADKALSAEQGKILGEEVFGTPESHEKVINPATLNAINGYYYEGRYIDNNNFTKRVCFSFNLANISHFSVTPKSGYLVSIQIYSGPVSEDTFIERDEIWYTTEREVNVVWPIRYVGCNISGSTGNEVISSSNIASMVEVVVDAMERESIRGELDELKFDTGVGVTGSTRYSGERPRFAQNTFNRKSIAVLPTHGSDGGLYPAVHQGFAVYGDYIVLMTFNKNVTPQVTSAILYNLATCEKLAEIPLPTSTYYRPHGNACIFGRDFHSQNSVLPLLYVSQWEQESERGFLAYDITLSNGVYAAELVQAIFPTNVSSDNIGAGQLDWTADFDNGILYSVGYKLSNGAETDSPTNPTMICKFNLPSISDGAVINLSDADMLDHYTVECTPYRQGVSFNNGKIMISSGVDNHLTWQWAKFIDADRKEIVTKVPLSMYNGEVEGIDVYMGNLVLGWRGDQNIYKMVLY